MLKNYIKIAYRNLKKNRFFSLLNILGLSIGLAISFLLLAYSKYELSYDEMYPNKNEIYRVYLKTTPSLDEKKWVTIPNIIGPQIAENVPGVLKTARWIKDDFGSKASIKVGQETFIEDRLYLTDSSFFSMFDVEFVEGNPDMVFKDSKSVVISESRKKKLFPDGNALNQLIAINQRDTVKVSAVYKDFPLNSTIDAEIILNIMDSWMGKNLGWGNASFETFCQVKPGADIAQIEKNATLLIDKNIPKDEQYYTNFYFQPLQKIHLYSAGFREGYSSRIGNIKTINVLLGLSVIILLIASINYMNLATARTSKNAKEVGVNKVLGASRSQITFRFYTETALITILSFILAFIFALLLVPFFKSLTNVEFSIYNLLSIEFFLWSTGLVIIITLLAGSFPSLYMSKIKSLVLMSKSSPKNSFVEYARQSLVVFQFVISSILIISISIMIYQMKYIKTKNLGYNPQEVISVSIKSINNIEKVQSLTGLINQIPGTISTTPVQSIPGENESGKSTYKTLEEKSGLPTFSSNAYGPIIKTLGLTLLAGRDLPQTLSKKDSNCYVLINEVVMRYLGYQNPQDAIGQKVITEMNPHAIIQGVIKDFNFHSLKENIAGYNYYMMNNPNENVRNMMIRFKTADLTAYLNNLEILFKREVPNSAFDFSFVDEHVQNQYISENRSSNIVFIFSGLTIFIACLGLIGLAAFTTEQRSKEIGIRKVLGANILSLTGLLSGKFLKLVLIAFLIASPIAWYIMNNWLEGFTYRIQIPWWSFVITALISILITALAIGYQTIKAAFANPVDSLRDE